MAVKFVNTASSSEILAALPLDAATKYRMKEFGIEVVFFPHRFEVHSPIHGGFEDTLQVSYAPSEKSWVASLSDMSEPSSKSAAMVLAAKVSEKVLEAAEAMTALNIKPAAPKSSGSPFSKLPPPSIKPAPVVQQVINTAPEVFPKETRFTAERVPLKEATQMYQPVRGTDQHSRYYVVALNDLLKVAARIKGDSYTVSIRVEGNPVTVSSVANSTPGLDLATGGHASLHVQAGSLMMANRVIGGLVACLMQKFDTPVPSASELING